MLPGGLIQVLGGLLCFKAIENSLVSALGFGALRLAAGVSGLSGALQVDVNTGRWSNKDWDVTNVCCAATESGREIAALPLNALATLS